MRRRNEGARRREKACEEGVRRQPECGSYCTVAASCHGPSMRPEQQQMKMGGGKGMQQSPSNLMLCPACPPFPHEGEIQGDCQLQEEVIHTRGLKRRTSQS